MNIIKILIIFLILISLSSFVYAGNFIDKLMYVWDLEETDTNATDEINGSVTVQAITSSKSVTGINGNAWNLTGGGASGGYIQLANGLLDDYPFVCLSAWFLPDTINDAHVPFYFTDGSNWGGLYTTLTLSYWKINTDDSVEVSTPDAKGLPEGNWLHIVYTYDGAGLSTWVNGEHNGSVLATGLTEFTGIHYIGRQPSGNYFKSTVDEITIWQMNCTEENVTNLYNSGTGSFYSDWVDVTPPTYSNFQNNASTTTKINEVVNWSIDLSDETGLHSYIFAHNNSGTLTNGSFISLSGTSAFVNTTVTITQPQGNYVCGQYWFNDTTDNINSTGLSCFTVDNTIPSISSVIVNDTTPSVGDTLNQTCVASDADSDTLTLVYRWFINDTLMPFISGNLSGGNVTLNANITASCNVTDGINTISKNSSKLTVGDSTSPILSGLGIDTTSGIIGSVITITATCTEANNLFEDNPKVSITHSVAGLKDNKTMNLVSGEDYSTTYTTAESSGTYSFNFYCMDGSGNQDINVSTGLVFTATTSSPGGSPGGGGGGGFVVPPSQCIETKDCGVFGEKYVCIQNTCVFQEKEQVCNFNGICEPARGENVLNCGDELANETTVIEGDCDPLSLDLLKIAASSQGFLWVALIGIILIAIYFNIPEPERKFKKIRRRFFKRRR